MGCQGSLIYKKVTEKEFSIIPTFPGKDFAKIHSSLMFGCASSDSLNYLTLSIFSHHGVMVLR